VDYEVTVNIPTAGAGTPVLIVGLGEIKNGSTVQVDTDQAAQFKNLTGTTLGRAAFQDGVTVKALRGKKDSDAPKPDTKPEPDHVPGTPAPVQNRDGETAKDGDK
jgi:hypothetical protein